jgi:acetoin utilization deacetylase AcuC-like enzyme
VAARPGVERVAYVDVDVHHGDGVERIFGTTRGC